MRRNRIIIIISAIVFVAVITVVSVVLAYYNGVKEKVIINNIGECASGISGYSRDNLASGMYNVVVYQNEVNNKKTDATYYATMRVDTCKTDEYNIDGVISYKTEGTLDIESLGYTYLISFVWIKDEMKAGMDLGVVNAYCASASELIFNDGFNCEKNPVIAEKEESVVGILPYFGEDYRVSIKGDGDSEYIEVLMDPAESVYFDGDVDEYVAEVQRQVAEYFRKNGLDVKNYRVEYIYKTW